VPDTVFHGDSSCRAGLAVRDGYESRRGVGVEVRGCIPLLCFECLDIDFLVFDLRSRVDE